MEKGNKLSIPLLVKIKWTTKKPIIFDVENGVNVFHRFEKTVRIEEYDPKVDYEKQLMEAAEVLMKSTKQFNQDDVILALEIIGDGDEDDPGIHTCIRRFDNARGMNEHIRIWFEGSDILL